MFKEFKKFIMRGNVMDMAVGVIIGGAFQKIISSLVEDIIMPLITMATGKVDFTDLVLNIGNTSIKYGSFISVVIDFIIIGFSLFIAIKTVNNLNKVKTFGKKKSKKNKESITPTVKECPYCLSEINYKATKCPHCTSDVSNVEKV